MHVLTGIKRCNINDNSFMLWHQRLRHISIERIKSLVKNEQRILSGNKLGSPMEAIETCILTLSSGFILQLERTFYVPSFSRNLISPSRLVPFWILL